MKEIKHGETKKSVIYSLLLTPSSFGGWNLDVLIGSLQGFPSGSREVTLNEASLRGKLVVARKKESFRGKRARKRTPPDRSLVTSTPGAVLQESLQVGRQMLGWDSNPSPQIEGRVASPLYQARTIVPLVSAPHTAAGPEWPSVGLGREAPWLGIFGGASSRTISLSSHQLQEIVTTVKTVTGSESMPSQKKKTWQSSPSNHRTGKESEVRIEMK
ncbi:unnamed protein product [Caenorhabditis auriculariae]|uniref:Uncharacterized protein n=1 Tax=Caenorhabditis auriculariae TaxID=2777116 RepID=A0A8S1HLM4_9PELO|nr:unnamed protein product [Caenorhabditis auriculariae]